MHRSTRRLLTAVLTLVGGAATPCLAQGLPNGGTPPPPPPQICPPSTPLILVLCTWPDRQGPTGPYRPRPVAGNDHRFISGGSPTPGGEPPPPPPCTPLTEGASTGVSIPNTRYIGPYVNAAGFIEHPDIMSSEEVGVISRYAELEISTFENNQPASCLGSGGTLRVRINGFDDVYLNQALTQPAVVVNQNAQAFNVTRLFVPIGRIKFPTHRGAGGTFPAAAFNIVELHYDAGPTPANGCVPCIAVDWAAITFKCMSPTVLIHGNSQSGPWWDRYEFTYELRHRFLPIDNSISMTPNATFTENNALALAGKDTDQPSVALHDIVASFGADSVHLVAHSKGGLDARRYLSEYLTKERSRPHPFTVLSLTALGTPHNGSVLGDIMQNVKSASYLLRNEGRILGVPQNFDFIGFPQGFATTATLPEFVSPTNDGHYDLRVAHCSAVNQTEIARLPRSVLYYAITADMDDNANVLIDLASEVRQLHRDERFGALAVRFAPSRFRESIDSVYQMLRQTKRVTAQRQRHTSGDGVNQYFSTTITAVRTGPTPLTTSDILVTAESGLGIDSFDRVSSARPPAVGAQWYPHLNAGFATHNHEVIASLQVAALSIDGILKHVERERGDLR